MAVGTYALTSLANLKAWIGISSSAFDSVLESSVDRATAVVESYLDREVKSRTQREFIDPEGQRTIVTNHHPITAIKTIAFGVSDAITLTLDDSSDVLATVENDGSSLKFQRINSSGSATSASLAFSSYQTTSQLVTQINSSVSGFSASLVKNAYSYSLHRFGGRGMIEATLNLTYTRDNISEYRVEFATGRIHMLSDRFPTYRSEYDFTNHFPSTFQSVFVEYTAGFATVPDDIEQATIEIAADMYRARKEDQTKGSESLGDYSYSKGKDYNERQAMILERLSMYRNLR